MVIKAIKNEDILIGHILIGKIKLNDRLQIEKQVFTHYRAGMFKYLFKKEY